MYYTNLCECPLGRSALTTKVNRQHQIHALTTRLTFSQVTAGTVGTLSTEWSSYRSLTFCTCSLTKCKHFLNHHIFWVTFNYWSQCLSTHSVSSQMHCSPFNMSQPCSLTLHLLHHPSCAVTISCFISSRLLHGFSPSLSHLSLFSTHCNLFTDVWMDLLHQDSEDIFNPCQHNPLCFFLPFFCLDIYLSFVFLLVSPFCFLPALLSVTELQPVSLQLPP